MLSVLASTGAELPNRASVGGSSTTARLTAIDPSALIAWTSCQVTGSGPVTYQRYPYPVVYSSTKESGGSNTPPGAASTPTSCCGGPSATIPVITASTGSPTSGVTVTASPSPASSRSAQRSVTATSPATAGRVPSTSGVSESRLSASAERSTIRNVSRGARSGVLTRPTPVTVRTSSSPSGSTSARAASYSARPGGSPCAPSPLHDHPSPRGLCSTPGPTYASIRA